MALDCTGQSAVNFNILHPALFDHGYMFWEKSEWHEQMEQKHKTPNNKFQGTYPNLGYKEHEDLPSCWSIELLQNSMDG